MPATSPNPRMPAGPRGTANMTDMYMAMAQLMSQQAGQQTQMLPQAPGAVVGSAAMAPGFAPPMMAQHPGVGSLGQLLLGHGGR